MRLHRSALFAGLLALGVAACGDDVQIVDPPPPPPPALNATLAPNASTIFVGEVADYGVGVSGGAAGETASWTCTSAAPGVATVVVTATGCRATGVAAGNTSINVVVTKGDQTANASSGITVNEIEVVPARLSIVGMTMVMPGPPPVVITAPINAVQGQLDVDLTLTRNTETPTLVELLLGGVVVASQTLTNQAPAEVDGQQVAEPIQFSFNTAFYTVANNVATVRHQNGARVLSARVTVTGGTVRSATEAVTITLVNPDQVHVQNLVLPTNNALSAGGQIWYGGPNSGNVGFTAVPVMFSGRTVSTIGLGGAFGAGCAAPGVDGSVPYDFASSCATAENAVNPVAGGFNAQATDGNAVNFGAAVGAGYAVPPVVVGTNPFPVFIDKVAPAGAALRFAHQTNIANRENWGNAAYALTTGYAVPGDGGVGLPSGFGAPNFAEAEFRVRTGTTVVAGHDFADNKRTLADLPNSVDNLTYNAQVRVSDRLGNNTTISQATNPAHAVNNPAPSSHPLATFGVDKDAPTATRGAVGAGAIASAQATLDVVAGENYEVQATDIVSGFAAPVATGGPGEALRHAHVSVLGTPNSTVLTTAGLIGAGSVNSAPFATANTGTTFVRTPVNYVDGYVQNPTSITSNASVSGSVVVPAGPAYYIYQAQARDKAGNLSNIVGWQVYVNNSSFPAITGLVTSLFFTGGAPAIFPAIAQDPVEVAQASFDLTYGAVARLVYERPSPSTATLFDDVITIPNPFNLTAPQFIRAVQTVAGAPTAFVPVVGQTIPSVITARPYNGLAVPLPVTGVVPASTGHADTDAGAANGAVGAGAYTSAGILSTQVQPGVDFTTLAAPVAISNFEIVSYGSAISGSNTVITVLVRATGPSGTFVNPFAGGLHILQRRGAGDAVPAAAAAGDVFLRPFIAPVTVAVQPQFVAPFPTLDNGVQRDYDWHLVITYPTASLPAFLNLQALGLSAGFDGLLSREVQIAPAAPVAAGTAPGTIF